MTEYIDIEPTWENICRVLGKSNPIVLELLGACKIADYIRQAQKKGAKSVTITFFEDNQIEVNEFYEEKK